MALNFANADSPSIGFCIVLLLGSKYAGVPLHWALSELPVLEPMLLLWRSPPDAAERTNCESFWKSGIQASEDKKSFKEPNEIYKLIYKFINHPEFLGKKQVLSVHKTRQF